MRKIRNARSAYQERGYASVRGVTITRFSDPENHHFVPKRRRDVASQTVHSFTPPKRQSLTVAPNRKSLSWSMLHTFSRDPGGLRSVLPNGVSPWSVATSPVFQRSPLHGELGQQVSVLRPIRHPPCSGLSHSPPFPPTRGEDERNASPTGTMALREML